MAMSEDKEAMLRDMLLGCIEMSGYNDRLVADDGKIVLAVRSAWPDEFAEMFEQDGTEGRGDGE
jgi:hypothetical protein